MNQDVFIARKSELINMLSKNLAEKNQNEIVLNRLLELLSKYTFENRLKTKGLLTHTIIDSMELEYSIGEKFIQFDNDIS